MIRRKLLLTLACRLCGSTQLKRDSVAIECVGCGAIRPRRPADEPLVAAIAGWEACPLSGSEMRALREIFDGFTYEQAAQKIGLSTSTVRTHMHNVYTKLQVGSAVQACLIAYERGWLRLNRGAET